jgi:hypothetical protein
MTSMWRQSIGSSQDGQVQTFNKLMQIQHEYYKQHKVLEVVSTGELVRDRGEESKEDGGVDFVPSPFLVAGRSLTLIRNVVGGC